MPTSGTHWISPPRNANLDGLHAAHETCLMRNRKACLVRVESHAPQLVDTQPNPVLTVITVDQGQPSAASYPPTPEPWATRIIEWDALKRPH
jgi:hypothetical protein